MATIEIKKEQYDAMINKIDTLSQRCTNLEREKEKLSQENEELQENLDIARTANWYDRVFGWKQILKLTEKDNDE